MVTIYLANLAAYNRGHLIGEHITLPIEDSKLEERVENILNGNEAMESRDFPNEVDEEYVIHDFDTELNIQIGEFTNIWELNNELQELEALSDDEITTVKVILNAGLEDSLITIINNLDKYIVYSDIHSDSDLGHHYLDAKDIPDYLTHYIDFAEYGKDSRVNDIGDFTDIGYIKKGY